MQSIAAQHFPRVVFRDGQKLLWNPILKKAYVNQPEERVRLRIIESLLLESEWSSHRITTELPLNLNRDEAKKRADILCYNHDFEPVLLIECKAENIAISEKTSLQITRYNSKIKAPYLMMSNGITDFFFEMSEDKSPVHLKRYPPILHPGKVERDFAYWSDRGFLGRDSDVFLRNWLFSVQESFWFNQNENDASVTYLSLPATPSQLNLEHYYKIFILSSNIKIAVSFMATPFSGNRLVAIVNEGGSNKGIIEIDLELIAKGISPNATIFHAGGEKGTDARPWLSFDFEQFDPSQISGIEKKLLELFNHHI